VLFWLQASLSGQAMMSDDFGPVLQKPALNLKLEGLQPIGVVHTAPLGTFLQGDAGVCEKKPGIQAHLEVTSSICEFAPHFSRHDVWPLAGWVWPTGQAVQLTRSADAPAAKVPLGQGVQAAHKHGWVLLHK
jgi:hypothetical protein